MPNLDKNLRIMIPEIMGEFEKDFNEIIGHLSLMWNFPVPSIEIIKRKNYDLYDKIWSKCWILGMWTNGIKADVLFDYKDEIEKTNDSKN